LKGKELSGKKKKKKNIKVEEGMGSAWRTIHRGGGGKHQESLGKVQSSKMKSRSKKLPVLDSVKGKE